jgi:hypothetical protein
MPPSNPAVRSETKPSSETGTIFPSSVHVLTTVDPFNNIFDKGYSPNKRQNVKVPNFDSFYDGLIMSLSTHVYAKQNDKEVNKKLELQIQ